MLQCQKKKDSTAPGFLRSTALGVKLQPLKELCCDEISRGAGRAWGNLVSKAPADTCPGLPGEELAEKCRFSGSSQLRTVPI